MPITPDLFPDFLLLNWLPDETLFSLVSRQHLLSGEVVASRTSERFFGGSRAGAQHDVPSRLATFVERTGGRLGGLQEVGLHRTLLNFYRAFITSQECTHALECMAGDSVAHLKLRLGILTSRFRAHHPLKACPVCMEEDASSTGWAYWHLQHQYPGVWVCTKHAQPLLSSTLKATGVQRFQWILPRQHELCDERMASQGDELSGQLFRLAALVETLVQRGAREPLPIPQLYRMYRYAMLQRGWLTAAGSLRMNVIAKEFLEHIRPLRIDAQRHADNANRPRSSCQVVSKAHPREGSSRAIQREMKAFLITLSAAALLAACGSPPKYAFVKEGASAHTTQSTMAKCEYQVKVQKTPVPEQASLKKLCMEGEGYRLKRVG